MTFINNENTETTKSQQNHLQGVSASMDEEALITTDMCAIMLTSNISADQAYEAYKLQANGFLQKPFSVKEFDKILNKQENQNKRIKN